MTTKTPDELFADISTLLGKIVDDEYNPDIVVACAIGGDVIAAILAKGLGIKPGNYRMVDIGRDGNDREIEYDAIGPISGKKVLLVEDDLVTGKGHDMVKKQLLKRGTSVEGTEVKIAALYVNEQSVKYADYWAECFPDAASMPDYPYKKKNLGDR